VGQPAGRVNQMQVERQPRYTSPTRRHGGESGCDAHVAGGTADQRREKRTLLQRELITFAELADVATECRGHVFFGSISPSVPMAPAIAAGSTVRQRAAAGLECPLSTHCGHWTNVCFDPFRAFAQLAYLSCAEDPLSFSSAW
jgi:hypothetical protein